MAAVSATPEAAAAAAPTIRAAEHFPRVLKPCKAAAEPFFKCFSAATLDPNADVSPVGYTLRAVRSPGQRLAATHVTADAENRPAPLAARRVARRSSLAPSR